MKKHIILAFSIIAACFLFLKTDARAYGPTSDLSVGIDKNQDGLVTYNELENWQRDKLRRGYNDGGSLGFQMIYNLSNPYIVDIANKNYIGSFHYRTYSQRIVSYYQTAKFNLEIYPRETGNWFVTKAREGADGVWHATVNCTSTANKLKTPETIYYNGHKCIVDTIELRNCYVKELTLTDNITAIRCCQTPFLREIYGGINVERIDPKAFMNDVYLVNLPYFPSLKAIHEFAFLGCLNLTEVLLPPLIETISWNAFGWMDCILGNYDPDFGTVYYEEDYEYRTVGRYMEYEKVEGITLYAAKDTVTYATLQELFSANDPRFNHLSYKEKNAYPGRTPAINLDPVINALEWIPPQSASTNEGWKDDEKPSEPETPAQAYNALTEEQRKCMDWIEELYLKEEIDEDMFIALTGSLCGLNPIPRDFSAEFYADEHYILLHTEYLRAALAYQKVYDARQDGRETEAKEKEDELNNKRKLLIHYVLKINEHVQLTTREMERVFNSITPDRLAEALSFINKYLDSIDKGYSFEDALKTLGYPAEKTEVIGQLTNEHPLLMAYESCIFLLFGKSKGADYASVITEGTHTAVVMTDLIVNPFYAAWQTVLYSSDEEKWEAFYKKWNDEQKRIITLYITEVEKTTRRTEVCFKYLYQFMIDERVQRATFEGYAKMFAENKFFSSYMQAAYDLAAKGKDFEKWLFDLVAGYYTEEQDVLNKRKQ